MKELLERLKAAEERANKADQAWEQEPESVEKENEFNQFKINESFILLNFTMSDVYEYMGVDPQENNHQILNSIINKIQSEKMAKLTQPAQQIIQ